MTSMSCRSKSKESSAVIPFVGRAREIREITDALTAGTNIVLVGPYGIGRSALVRQVAQSMRSRLRFVFADFSGTPGEASDALVAALAPLRAGRATSSPPGHKLRRFRIARMEHGRKPTVVVMEDIARFTDPMARFIRFLELRTGFRYVAIAERSMPPESLTALRARLSPSILIRLGPLSQPASTILLRRYGERHNLGWTDDEVRMAAACTVGRPARILEFVQRAVERRSGIAPAASRSNRSTRP